MTAAHDHSERGRRSSSKPARPSAAVTDKISDIVSKRPVHRLVHPGASGIAMMLVMLL